MTEATPFNKADHPTGWICPVCGRGNAPWKGTCDCAPLGSIHVHGAYSVDCGRTWIDIAPPDDNEWRDTMLTLFGK